MNDKLHVKNNEEVVKQSELCESVKALYFDALPIRNQFDMLDTVDEEYRPLGHTNFTAQRIGDEARKATKMDAKTKTAIMAKASIQATPGEDPQPKLTTLRETFDAFAESSASAINTDTQITMTYHVFAIDTTLAMAMFNYSNGKSPEECTFTGLSKALIDAYKTHSAMPATAMNSQQAGYAQVATTTPTMMAADMAELAAYRLGTANAARMAKGAQPTAQPGAPTPRPAAGTPKEYCHSHGYGAHPSPGCLRPGPQHDVTATFANNKGGAQRGADKKYY